MSEICGFLVAILLILGIPVSVIWMIYVGVKKEDKKNAFRPILIVLCGIIIFSIIGVSSTNVGNKSDDLYNDDIIEETPTSEENIDISNMDVDDIEENTIDYLDAESFEKALIEKIDVTGKTVRFQVREYRPDSIIGINCWSGEHLNFISEDELDVASGDYIVGKVLEKPSKVLRSWKIPYVVISIEKNSEIVEAEKKEIETKGEEESSHTDIGNEFKEAVESIGMDYSQVKNIEKLERWASGERYSFIYDGFRYIVYEFDDGEIDSINTELKRTKIYENGYEPLSYKDFEPDKEILGVLQNDALMKMTEYITGATQLNIKMGSLLYDRVYDYYTISGIVKAKNSTNKEEYSFTIDYLINETDYECTYLALDGKIVYGEDKAPEVRKKEVLSDDVENRIILSDGKIGNYGKVDIFDGEEYIRYYVEEGMYQVICKKIGGFYIETIEIKKENGYDSVDIIAQHMLNTGNEMEIEIQTGQCISLIINTEIELIKK